MPSLRSRSPKARLAGPTSGGTAKVSLSGRGRHGCGDRDLLEGQFSDGCGKFDRAGAEADADGFVRILDVVDDEPRDRGGPLSVEEQQQAGEAAFGLEGVSCRKRRAVAHVGGTHTYTAVAADLGITTETLSTMGPQGHRSVRA